MLKLESERAKLIDRLGKRNVGDPSLELTDQAPGTLEKILERLESIDKRLEKIERQK
jgi:hypothetical protein